MLDFESVARVLVGAPSAWLSEAQLTAALGVEDVDARLAVAGLVAGGLLARDRPTGPVVTLTPLGEAARRPPARAARRRALSLVCGDGLDPLDPADPTVDRADRGP